MVLAHLLVAAALQQAAPPEQVLLTPTSVEITVDETATFEVRVLDANGRELEDAPLRWFVQDGDVAAFDGDTGVITALRPGRTGVFVVAGQKVGRANVTVPQLPAVRLDVRLPDGELRAGESVAADIVGVTRLGDEVTVDVERVESLDPRIAWADAGGRIYGGAPGETSLEFSSAGAATVVAIEVLANPATEYRLSGIPDAPVRTGDVLRLTVEGLRQGRAVSTPTPVWTVDSPAASVEPEGVDGVFVAEDPGGYRVVAAIGESSLVSAVIEVEPRDVGAEARLVQLGRGPNADHHSGDTWAFEGLDGRDYAYVGTYQYDWMRVWDVTDPTAPVLTDSMQLDARRINDVKIHPNREIGILTREGASDRRNGIVILDLSDPSSPSILSEYEETVTGGVHNVWVDGENDLVYACHNGTSELHIVDISNPAAPTEVGRWGIERESKTLHDVIVQDGYAYLSYWDDGLVILDVGAGSHGGSPTEPAFVSRIAYPAGNTHTAFRYGRYVFVGDEIFPDDWDPTRPIEARGFIHVIDVEDIDAPREVARYEVPEAGAHNIWVEDDRLYVGYYQAGLRVVDVSGELRGDLYRQGREIAVLKTGAPDSVVPNWGMTWGAQLHKGNIFTSDLNSGLWIARLQMRPLVP